MLKKLRRKFIALNMAIVALALTITFSAICYVTYRLDLASIEATMEETLGRIATARVLTYDDINILGANTPENDGPGLALPFERGDGSVLAPGIEGLKPPEIGGGSATKAQLTPLVSYAVDAQGVIVSLSDYSTALIPNDYLDQAITSALVANNDFGSIGSLGLLYGRHVDKNVAYLTFADASAVEGWKTLAFTLALVEVVALAAFFIISVYFARWALRPVEQAWAQQQQFIADASHELKTPLTVILANTAILKSHPHDTVTEQSQWIESTQTEAKRMQGLVNDMLDLARINENAETPVAHEPVNLSDLTEGEVLQFESVAFERGVTIEESVQPDIIVKGNAQRLQRMVRTIVDNACKYTDPGERVDVQLKCEGRNALITVRNSGAVISAEDLPHIFDRFYRADKSRTRETGGYGLGLAIAREIAREHGGNITAASSPEAGTTFAIAIPLSK